MSENVLPVISRKSFMVSRLPFPTPCVACGILVLQTRAGTCVLCVGSMESEPLDHQGSHFVLYPMFISLSHFEFIFMYGDLTSLIFMCCLAFSTLAKETFSYCINLPPLLKIVWVYFWVLYSVPLTHMSVFVPIPNCFDYCSFVVLSLGGSCLLLCFSSRWLCPCLLLFSCSVMSDSL